MSRKLVLKVLLEIVDHQGRTIAGGIIGGKQEVKFANDDLDRYVKAFEYAKKHLK